VNERSLVNYSLWITLGVLKITVVKTYYNKIMRSKKKGFTLIELLIVVAIIGVLASVVLASLNSARAKARNANRISGIKQIITAFNLAYTAAWPINNSGAWACISATCYNGFASYVAVPNIDAFFTPYMPSKPIDPAGGSTNRFGGVIYSQWVGGTSPYDGHIEPAGNYIYWAVEPPLTPTSCGPGKIWNAGADSVNCHFNFE